MKLYNVIFPIWFLLAIPLTWIFVLPANFIIDFLVIYITFRLLKQTNAFKFSKQLILRVWGFGFLSDIIGGLFMFLLLFIEEMLPRSNDWFYHELLSPVMYNPFESIWAVAYVIGCMIISSLCIYYLNRHFSFKNVNLDFRTQHILSLVLAVVTSPYVFLLPTTWFY